MWSFLDFLNDESMVTVLDVGAAITLSPPYQMLVDAKRARLIGFEPDAAACKKLNETFGEPHRFYPYFVGDGNPAIFHETNWGPTGSLFEPNAPLLDKFHWLGDVTRLVARHPVTTKRLDDIGEIADVDFVKIDVQGGELAVFQNASRVLASAVLIQTEVGFVESYKQQPMFSDVDAFLRGQGYQFIGFQGIGCRSFKPLLNKKFQTEHHLLRPFRQAIWADAYYVKDWMHLDRLPPTKLKNMAMLLHEIVGAYDLAYVVLQEMDRQSGSDFAPRYLRRLRESGDCVVDTGEHETDYFAELTEECESVHAGAPSVSSVVGRPSTILKTADGISISVPASLNCITTYVLLEQEKWFEREVEFVLRWMRQGMNAVDIGANVGVYSLPIARRVGPAGRVFAFEPGSENRSNLEAGRLANSLPNLEVSACALADSEKEGWLLTEGTGEMNSLIQGQLNTDRMERIRVSTMDAQESASRWPSIDFVKIDAEGQEGRIIAGGRDFFSRQSPLVMYEVANKEEGSSNLRWTFEALGYGTYRLLGDASCLVPVASDEITDRFELNLFAAKPDRAASLAAAGFLAMGPEPAALTEGERNDAIDCMLKLPYARSFEFSREDILGCSYRDALVAYAAFRFVPMSPGRRFEALSEAFRQLRAYCANSPVAAAQATLARVALDLGYRHMATDILKHLYKIGEGDIDQPFFPACARYEQLVPDGHEADWFAAAAIEQMESSRAHSSMYVSPSAVGLIRALCDSPFASAAMSRRMILKLARQGRPMSELRSFFKPEHDHGNADYWSEPGLEKLVSLLT